MRKALLSLLVIVVIVGAGGFVADSWARGRAEAQVAAAIQTRLGLARKPGVTIGGFPFSLAFLTRTVPSVRVSAERVPVEVSGKTAEISGVLAESDAISLVGDRVRLDRVTVTGVLGYAELGDLAGVPIRYAGDGRIALTYTTQVSGHQLTVGITAQPRLDVDAGVIRLAKPRADADTAAQVKLSQTQLQRLARPLPVQLGSGVRLTSLAPSEGGVAVAATATDVSIAIG